MKTGFKESGFLIACTITSRRRWVIFEPVYDVCWKQSLKFIYPEEEPVCFIYDPVIAEWQSVRAPMRKACGHHLQVDFPLRQGILRSPQITKGYWRPIRGTAGQAIKVSC